MDERVTAVAPTGRSARLLSVVGGLLITYGVYFTNQDVFSRAFASRDGLPPDPITALVERWEPVREGTPPDGSYGFIGDPEYGEGELVKRLYIAEYVLAPRLLSVGPNQPLVLGIFDKPFTATLRRLHLQIVKDYGRGILLLKAAP